MDVVFDIGNVLLQWDPRFLYRKVFAEEARMERFLAEVLSPDFFVELDLADDFAEPIERRAVQFPEFVEELRLFDTRWLETLDGPIAENVGIIERLRAQRRPVYALSNYTRSKFDLTRPLYPFLDSFDAIVVSGREGVAKPDPRIFHILFERAGRDPRDLVFVDDNAMNIAAAQRLGMRTIHYMPGTDVARRLRGLGALR